MNAKIYKTKINKIENTDIKYIDIVKESSKNYKGLGGKISSPEDLYNQIINIIEPENFTEEQFWLLCYNTKLKNIGNFLISQGTINTTIVHPREVFKRAIAINAAKIAITHNHPTGDSTPSNEDILLTKRLSDCGDLLGIELIDHIITGENKYYSMKKQNKIK